MSLTRLALCFLVFAIAAAIGADLSGTWQFSVDLDNGGHGDPTFVFEQKDGNLTGTYKGLLGEHKVTGTVTGNKAVFGFEFEQEGNKAKATYTGTLEGATKMTGTVEFQGGPEKITGKWTASKK
jgi:hypothetical protein